MMLHNCWKKNLKVSVVHECYCHGDSDFYVGPIADPKWQSISMHVKCAKNFRKITERSTRVLYFEHSTWSKLREIDVANIKALCNSPPNKMTAQAFTEDGECKALGSVVDLPW